MVFQFLGPLIGGAIQKAQEKKAARKAEQSGETASTGKPPNKEMVSKEEAALLAENAALKAKLGAQTTGAGPSALDKPVSAPVMKLS